ncbi:MAG: DUF3310 domain-containing protein [Selenomonas ruminantium]|jgi:hypothetical protein|uniref:DUF3310 domain-containing protein n=1 Tax=Selenomonas ruminantium TaxID=971 RepID=A0A927WHF4_SELRU|nr:DUF3310 domain-containing protein [Selenomonas ruminantium]
MSKGQAPKTTGEIIKYLLACRINGENPFVTYTMMDTMIESLMEAERIARGNKGVGIHPEYYRYRGGDVYDIAAHFELDFPTGNALKYLLRAGHKDPGKKKEDLVKAMTCIQRAIELMESGKQ